jgi:hypothetical protein
VSAGGGHRALGIAVDHDNREKDDFYPTPPEATEALLRVESFGGPIWEPACGDGAISRILEAAGHTVTSSDLVDRGYGEANIDFLMEWQPRAPNIVTNPPFKLALQFVEHALSLTTGKVCMLGRLAWLEGQARRERLYDNSPIARVHVFSKRLTMQRGRAANDDDEGGMIAFAWFVWEKGYEGKPTLGWL